MRKLLPVFGVLFNDACLFASGYAWGAGHSEIGGMVLLLGFAGAGVSIWFFARGEHD